jgi:hypothetical protein
MHRLVRQRQHQSTVYVERPGRKDSALRNPVTEGSTTSFYLIGPAAPLGGLLFGYDTGAIPGGQQPLPREAG